MSRVDKLIMTFSNLQERDCPPGNGEKIWPDHVPEKYHASHENRSPSDDLRRLNQPDDVGFPPSDIGEKKFNWGSVASTLFHGKPFGQLVEGLSLILE
jgi:hypothetical protein